MQQPTIFLSYGRADTADLAERLHDDLSAAGFRIWQDRERIRTGRNWDVEIEAGLRESRALVALLSPHSVRRAADGSSDGVDSVCLDEIAYARGVCRIPIVPVRTAPCTTPLLIYRLQAVDITAWRQSDSHYAAAVAELSEYLREALGGVRRERILIGGHESWDFAPFLLEKRRGFVGREWLFQEIEAWRQRTGAAALVITGEPGTGKSAIVAELVATNPGGQILAYHCCQADTPATLEPARFVRSLAAMIAARVQAYAELLDEVGAQDALSESRSTADPGGAFEAAILAPLHRLTEEQIRAVTAEGPAYLLVDALDEALVHQPGVTIVDILASRLERLPPWLRVVATTRNDRRVLQRLAGMRAHMLDAGHPRNVDDVRLFTTRALSQPELYARLKAEGRDPARAVTDLMQASSGNFLFATKAIEAIASGELSVAQIRSLPPGLGGLYGVFFSRLFPDGDGALEQAKVLLQVLVSAREAMNRAQLGAATGIDPDEALPALLSRLSAFLPLRDGRYSLFHRSLFEWLTGWDANLDVPFAGRFFANPKKGDARLADRGWGEYARGVRTLSAYDVRHLPRHLAGAGRVDDLLSLVTDWRFMEAKVKGHGAAGTSVFDLVGDLALASEAAQGTDPGHPQVRIATLLAEAIRFDAQLVAGHPETLFQCCWSRCWWHDCPQAAHFFESDGEDGSPLPNAPWRQPGEKLHAFMERWREEKTRATPGFMWMRSLRPPPEPIGAALRAVLPAHQKGSIHLAISPDEKRLLSGGEGGSVRLWDIASGAPLASFDIGEYEPNGSVMGVGFLPGADAVIATANRTVFLLRADTLSIETAIEIPGELISAVALAADGRLLALGHFDGALRIVNMHERRELSVAMAHAGAVRCLAFSPDGLSIATGGDSGAAAVRVWRLEDEALDEVARIAEDASVDAVAFSPTGGQLVWSSYTGRIACRTLSDARQWSVQAFDGTEAPVSCLAFDPSGARVFFGAGDVFGDTEAEVGVLDLATQSVVRRLHGHSSMVHDVLSYRQGSGLISAAHDSTIRLWSLDAAQASAELPWWERKIQVAAFSPDGRRIYTGSGASTAVIVRDLNSGELIAHYPDHDRGTYRLAVSHDGSRLFAGDVAGVVRVWRTDEQAPPAVWAIGATHMREMRTTSDDRLLGLLTYSGLVLVDATTGATLLTAESNESLTRLQFSDDGRLVAAIGACAILVLETQPATVIQRLVSEEPVYGSICAFADGNATLVYEGIRRSIHAMDARTGSAHELTADHRAALERVRDDHGSPFAWGVRAPPTTPDLAESEMAHEMVLGHKASGKPVAWIPLPWTHDAWHHPSGRCWALARYGQLWVVRLEGDL